MKRSARRAPTALLLPLLAAALGAGCMTASYQHHDPRPRTPSPADVQAEIAALAQSLEERASLRTGLGTARVLIEELEVVQPREARYRYAVLEEREVRATQATIRHELEMSLGNRLNVVDTAALARRHADAAERRRAAGATHAVTGTLLRDGGDVEIALKLVDLRDGWIVATAQRRIERFVPRDLVPSRADAEEARRRTAEVDGPADPAPETLTVIEPGAPAPAPVEPGPPLVDENGVPLDAEIEFEAGPAASRLEAIGGAGAPGAPGAPGAEGPRGPRADSL